MARGVGTPTYTLFPLVGSHIVELSSGSRMTTVFLQFTILEVLRSNSPFFRLANDGFVLSLLLQCLVLGVCSSYVVK